YLFCSDRRREMRSRRDCSSCVCSSALVTVMLIDEPFMGLAVYAVDYFLVLLKEKINAGMSVVLTSHQLDQVKDIADTFMMLEEGRVKSTGDIHEFTTITKGFQDD